MIKPYKDRSYYLMTVIIGSLLYSLLTVTSPQRSFAQNLTTESNDSTSQVDTPSNTKPPAEHLVTSTDDGTVILVFDVGGDRSQSTITFLDPTTKKPLQMVDYDILVRVANTSNIVWKASKDAGHEDRPLRTENGFAPILDNEFDPGSYGVDVSIYGINWNQLPRVDHGGAIYEMCRVSCTTP